jgi:hypothetical protein
VGKLIARIPNWARVLLFFILFAIAGRWISTLTPPAQYAERSHCLERTEAGVPYRNACGEALNVRFCFANDGARKTCGTATLAPGEIVPDLSRQRLAAQEKHLVRRTRWHACAAPYIPQDVPSRQNAALMVDGCSKTESDEK